MYLTCVKYFGKFVETLYFEIAFKRYFINECLMFNEVDRMFNVMEFGSCVANRNVCLWNKFANKFIYKQNDFPSVW